MGKINRSFHRHWQPRRPSVDLDSVDHPGLDAPDHGLAHDLRNEAKLWSMYVEEATEQDKSMLKGWNDALDVLLILAGLFSAVLTAFLMESYKFLQPDPQENTAALLLHVVQQLDEVLHSNDSVAFSRVPGAWSPQPSQPFEPAASAWWLNVTWFSSLICSLSAAFIAMLAKQWLQAYTSDRPGGVEMHARQRHFRYSGLQKWGVSEIISTLPVLLQLGFALFFVGLDVLLWTINEAIASLMTFLTALLLGFYAVTTIAPLFDASCPYKTPFSLAFHKHARWAYHNGCALVEYTHALFMAIRFRTSSPSFRHEGAPLSNVDVERIDIDCAQHTINVGIVEWLVATSHRHDVLDTALRAISSLRPDFNATPKLRDSGAIQLLVDRLDPPQGQLADPLAATVAFRCHAANSLQYLASMLCSLRHCTQSDIAQIGSRFHWRAWVVSWEGDFTLEQLVSDGWDLDALALYLCASTQCDRAAGRRANREFWVMVELLNRHSSRQAKLSSFAVWALVDTIALWGAEFGEPSMLSTRPAVVACLLRLLGLPYTMGDPVTRAIGVALGVFALDFSREEIMHYRDEEKRREDAQVLLIRGVVAIMKETPSPSARYSLNKDDFEAGGMVICKLLIENNVPSWSGGVSAALVAVLAFSTSENLTCRVLETFRRLLSFDSQSTVPDLSSTIVPLLDSPATQSVQINATQVLGEMMHWREHRNAILRDGGIQCLMCLIRNLTSPCGDLSNASSLALIGMAMDSHARDSMLELGLAEALTSFFGSNHANQQNLAYWSWTFVGSSWMETREWNTGASDFRKAFRELARVLEDSIHGRGLQKDVARTPVRRRDLQRILQSLKRLSERWETEGCEDRL